MWLVGTSTPGSVDVPAASRLFIHTHLLTMVGVMVFIYNLTLVILMFDTLPSPSAIVVPVSTTCHIDNSNTSNIDDIEDTDHDQYVVAVAVVVG
jgi:hypothetical protein